MGFQSMEAVIKESQERGLPFFELILEAELREQETSRAENLAKMKQLWQAMLEAEKAYQPDLRSKSGLAGGDGEQMRKYQTASPYCGSFVCRVIETALRTAESNACMRKVVAAPTAGASGVLPAVLIPCYQELSVTEEQIIEALYTAGGIGQIIAGRAFLSGAAGGCQAEVGSASAMAAGALVHLKGGHSKAIGEAVAIALKNLLGLVCDPVAGLVEVPCIKRNVIGAVNALSSADMALAGITSRIPPDQVIDAMKDIGEKMDSSLRETAKGGLAATSFAKEIEAEMFC